MTEETANKHEENALSRHYGIKGLLLFALPTIITAVFSSIYGVVDGLFVSNVAGSTAFGAINLASPLFIIVASIGFMFGTGGTALVSKTMGEGKREEANRIFSLLTYALILFGTIATILLEFFYDNLLLLLGCSETMLPYCLAYGNIIIPFMPFFMLMFYFQGFSVTAGKPKFGLAVMLITGFSNIIGDAILVGLVAPKMEDVPTAAVQGAAIATAFGLFLAGIIPFVYYLSKNKSLLRLGKPFLSFKAIGQTCSNGISEFLSNVSASIVSTVYNGILLYIIGDNGVAAYGAISYVNTIFASTFIGFSIGVAPIISYNYGAKRKDELHSNYKNSMTVILISSVIMTLLSELLTYPLASLFSGSNEEVKLLIISGMKIFSLSFLLKGVNMYASAFFTALNNGMISGILAFLRTLVFSLGAILILPLVLYYGAGGTDAVASQAAIDAGMTGVWWAVNVAEGLSVITAILFLRLKKKKYGY